MTQTRASEQTAARPGSPGRVRLHTLREALAYLDRLDEVETASGDPDTGWTFPQVLVHCAQSIEFSMRGYPKPKNPIIRATIGRAAKRVFIARGAMKHDRSAVIPGAPAIPRNTTRADAGDRLNRAVKEFEAFSGEYAPHFTFGSANKRDYELLHAIHIADHLSAFPVSTRDVQLHA